MVQREGEAAPAPGRAMCTAALLAVYAMSMAVLDASRATAVALATSMAAGTEPMDRVMFTGAQIMAPATSMAVLSHSPLPSA